MSISTAQSSLRTPTRRFAPDDLAFARAWEVHAPGLGGWTVQMERDDEWGDSLLVDPPLVYGDGFVVRPEEGGTTVTWAMGARRVASLREAMLLICPLSPDALAAVELLAAAPNLEF
ncbi:MAG TPA: hypothetical protein VE650_09300 [Acetobacteraceae bacterium]|nr:hypothetical protein [Acetobacteraceae bacterium]